MRGSICDWERKNFYGRLLWLFPLAYLFHVLEEASGFSLWVAQVIGGQIGQGRFYLTNGIVMLALLGLCCLASRRKDRPSTFLLFWWVSGQLFWNFVFHLYAQIRFSTYAPGVWTATFLYFPLYLYLSYLALRESYLGWKGWAGGLALGAVGMGIVVWANLYHFGAIPWSAWI